MSIEDTNIEHLKNEVISLNVKLDDSIRLNNEMLTGLRALENKCALNFRGMKQKFDEVEKMEGEVFELTETVSGIAHDLHDIKEEINI